MATPDESLVVGAQRMADKGACELVVVEALRGETHPVGMVSEHDLVRALARGSIPPDVITIKDVMRTDVVTVREDDGVDEAIAKLTRHGERGAVAVVDEHDRVQGVLGIDALLASRTPTSGLLRAFGGGVVAGAVAAVVFGVAIVVAHAALGFDPRELLARDQLAIEVATYLGVALLWGAVFGLCLYGMGRAVTLFAGLPFGVVAWLVAVAVVVPLLGLAPLPVPHAIIALVGFGVLVAAGFLPFQRALPRITRS